MTVDWGLRKPEDPTHLMSHHGRRARLSRSQALPDVFKWNRVAAVAHQVEGAPMEEVIVANTNSVSKPNAHIVTPHSLNSNTRYALTLTTRFRVPYPFSP